MVAYKIRLYPNASQRHAIHYNFGAVRYIYNRILALRIYIWKRWKKIVKMNRLINHIARIKSYQPWLADADSQALQQAVRNMETAFRRFFLKDKKGKKAGFPKFRSKHFPRQSFQYPQRVKISEDKKKLYLPKVGWVRARFSREVPGKIKTVTVSLHGGRYHAAVLTDAEFHVGTNNGHTLGIDVGTKFLVADSNGLLVSAPSFDREVVKLRRRYQRLSRRVKGSKRYEKAKNSLARMSMKIADIRKDFLHKLSKTYSENQTVVIEALEIKRMTASAKGDLENPGKNVKWKTFLNRIILQAGWGMFFEFLGYKLDRNGGELRRVTAAYTSQTCSACGHVSKRNRRSRDRFECERCGEKKHADTNASEVIRDRGLKES